MPNKQSVIHFIVPGILLEFAFLYLLLSGDWNKNIPSFLGVFFLAFCLYLFVIHVALAGKVEATKRATTILFTFAVMFRFTLLFSIPSISEDFYRYIWDGRVANSGIGPYDYPPEAKELAHLRDQNYERVNHKNVRTPYPPFAENVYRGLAKVTNNRILFKAGLLAFDILLLATLLQLIRKEQISPHHFVIYAWHPLIIVEFSGSAHIDVVSISLLFLSLLLLSQSKRALSGITLALSVLTKYLSLGAIPWMWKKGRWTMLIFFALTGALLILQYYTEDLRLWYGLSTFYRKWRFNDSLFGILYDCCGGAEAARRIGFLFVASIAAFSFFRNFSVYRGMFMIIGTTILFSPVVHPWYVCWIVPFLVFHPNRPWIFFSGWIALAYLIRFLYPAEVWKPVLWLKILIYVPFFVMLIAQVFHKRKVNSFAS